MVKVALVSDLHFDVNHQDLEAVIPAHVAWLKQHRVGVYLIAGDISNHFAQSLAYAERMQAALAPAQVRFVAGNHDMLHDVTYDELGTSLGPTYLHRQFLDITETNWRIVGNNGWYDYGFADNLPGRDFATWKRAFWVDGSISQPQSDPERLAVELPLIQDQLDLAREAGKRVLFMTHFVPRREFIRYTDDNRFWNMANALLGSPQMGDLLAKNQVETVLFGHVHRHFTPRQLAGSWYYDQAVGYHNRRINEWTQADFSAEWQQRVRILNLN